MVRRPVFLLTDFGAASHYVGIMRAVIEDRLPGAIVHDLSHEITSGNVDEAAYILSAAWDYLPRRCVVVAVIDPTVGTERKTLLLRQGGRLVLAPDNGLLTGILEGPEPRDLFSVKDQVLAALRPSATFHGRDVFAPLAAALARWSRVAGLVDRFRDPVRLGAFWAPMLGGEFQARVVHVDRFGNLITNVPMGESRPRGFVRTNWPEITRVPLVRTFAEVRVGAWLAYRGSSGRLEFGVRDGSAREALDGDLRRPLHVRPP